MLLSRAAPLLVMRPDEFDGEEKLRILCFVAALLAASPALAKATSPTQLERETWLAFKAKRVAEIRSMFAPGYVGLYADGTKNLERELEDFKRVTIENYSLSDFSSREVDPDDVLLTYAADVHLSVDGKRVSERLWIASLWHRSNKRWLTAYHSEIKAK